MENPFSSNTVRYLLLPVPILDVKCLPYVTEIPARSDWRRNFVLYSQQSTTKTPAMPLSHSMLPPPALLRLRIRISALDLRRAQQRALPLVLPHNILHR